MTLDRKPVATPGQVRWARRRVLWALGSAGLVSACATRPPSGSDVLSGRLAVQVAATASAAARQISSGFELRGGTQAGELDLLSPLGTVVARARWRPGTVEVASSEGTRRFASLSELARQTVGESIPLEALADWLRARPWSGASHAATDTGFEQAGWRVDVSRASEGFIVVRREAPEPAVTLRARLDTPVAKPFVPFIGPGGGLR